MVGSMTFLAKVFKRMFGVAGKCMLCWGGGGGIGPGMEEHWEVRGRRRWVSTCGR